MYTTTFTAGLNALQVHQVNGEIDNRTSTHTQLHVVPSKLMAASLRTVHVYHTHSVVCV